MDQLVVFLAGKTECSVALSPEGWAWFVSGRHLVVWKYAKPAGGGTSSGTGPLSRKSISVASPKSYELTLPPSDLAHKADLVAAFFHSGSSDSGVPSCIAVSPEGTVRYWDSVTHENFFVEINADLQVRHFAYLNVEPTNFLNYFSL